MASPDATTPDSTLLSVTVRPLVRNAGAGDIQPILSLTSNQLRGSRVRTALIPSSMFGSSPYPSVSATTYTL